MKNEELITEDVRLERRIEMNPLGILEMTFGLEMIALQS